jgi:hypothetical protein
MAIINTDVEVDLDDFDTWELREELECRGYYVSSEGFDNIEEFNDRDLIDEINRRGYTVYGKKADIPWELYQAYLLDNDEKFRKYAKKILIENGFKP